MIRDPEIIDYLEDLPTETFDGQVFRACIVGRDPTSPSQAGGRWMLQDHASTLYTSMQREGALAEVSSFYAALTPLPTKPVVVHTLRVECSRTLRLVRMNLEDLGIIGELSQQPDYNQTQLIGDAAAWLERDGLIIPSARWDTDNLVIFTDNIATDNVMTIEASEQVDWQSWARANGILLE